MKYETFEEAFQHSLTQKGQKPFIWYDDVYDMCAYLIKAHAEQEQQHVDDLVCNKFSSKGHHDEHPSTDIDPVFGIAAHHHASQNLQHRFITSLLV